MIETTIMNDARNAVIISVTAEHNRNNIYNRMIGVPEKKSHKIAMEHIEIGTRIYIHYIGVGISKIVEAVSTPYISHIEVPEWDNNRIEKYSQRINTKVIWDIINPITPLDVVDLGISHINSGKLLTHHFPQHSMTPISASDSDIIFETVVPKTLSYWEIDGNKYRRG